MVMKKKAQAAMEFLMTYGWAILVVLVVIGALAYFGVLNPQNLLPEKCTLPMNLYCKDHFINGGADTISLKLENGMGHGVIIRNVTLTGQTIVGNCNFDTSTCSDASCSCCTGDHNLTGGTCNYNDVPGWHIGNGEMVTITIDCGDNKINEFSGKTKSAITIVYCDETSTSDGDCESFSHTLEGELMARVE